ncbi:hypothetical protein HAX54_028390, partial [Datura stramonium]|nr:hypothetical protein [Datura stramonium]
MGTTTIGYSLVKSDKTLMNVVAGGKFTDPVFRLSTTVHRQSVDHFLWFTRVPS